jgi:NAD(H)-dependent 7beta-hydroxy-3-oxo-delta4-cholenoic acid oxidoreductase
MHPGPAGIFFNDGLQPVSASPVPTRAFGEIPRPLSTDEIAAMTEKFGQAARRAREAGFDAVELHCCHVHGLLGRFLSSLSSKRTDKYGGNLDGRLKFPLEVIDCIHKYAGEDFPIIVRLNATDKEPGGQTFMEALYIARRFEAAGVSMIHLSDGSYDDGWNIAKLAGAK